MKTNLSNFSGCTDNADTLRYWKRGLTIQNATALIRQSGDHHGKRAIINIGTTDICHNIGYHDICVPYMELVQLCIAKGMKPTITTLMPINSGFGLYSMEISWKIFHFNTFLLGNFTNVIDSWSCFSSGFEEKLSNLLLWYVCWKLFITGYHFYS